MAKGPQRQAHPKLTPPRTIWKRTAQGKVRVGEETGHEGAIVFGRVWTYHPTKGWRSRAVTPPVQFEGKHPIFLQLARAMFRTKGIAV